MESNPSGRTTAIALFRRFYAEVLACRARAVASASVPVALAPVAAPPVGAPPVGAPPVGAAPAGAAPPFPPPAAPVHGAALLAEELSNRLVHTLERLAVEAARDGGPFAAAMFGEAKYAMAALADDIFLSLDWPGRGAWKAVLLEQRLFNSYVAGEALFQRIDRLLQQPDGSNHDLAAVYLAILGLGFEGKFRAHDGHGHITEYRLRLHRLLTKGRIPSGRASARAYERLISDAKPRFLPTARVWYWAIGATVGLFLVVSHIVWTVNVAGIAEELGGARAAIENLGTTWPN